MTKQTEAMKLALEALEPRPGMPNPEYESLTQCAITALREALAEQPAQQQCRTDGRCQYAIDSGAEGLGHCPKGKCIMPAQQEPVAWMTINAYGEEDDIHYENPEGHLPEGWTYKPLYTSPPPQRKPLTDEEILALARDHYNPHQRAEISFARAIEAAHGIKENT